METRASAGSGQELKIVPRFSLLTATPQARHDLFDPDFPDP